MENEPDNSKPDFMQIEPETQDFRGRYGFGRPAHKPDPEAKYGFEPQNRILPPSYVRQSKR